MGLQGFDKWRRLLDNKMSMYKPRSDWHLVALLSIVISAHCETIVNGRPSIVLESKVAAVVIDLGGGSIVQFQLRDQGLNPLTWIWAGKGIPAVHPMGHFLCLDRWGAPSDAEAKNGMPFHGEAAWVVWKVTQEPRIVEHEVRAEMEASLPMAGMILCFDATVSFRAMGLPVSASSARIEMAYAAPFRSIDPPMTILMPSRAATSLPTLSSSRAAPGFS